MLINKAIYVLETLFDTDMIIKYKTILADTDGLIREEVARTTTLPAFMTNSVTNSQPQVSTEEVKTEPDANVPDDIANFYQV